MNILRNIRNPNIQKGLAATATCVALLGGTACNKADGDRAPLTLRQCIDEPIALPPAKRYETPVIDVDPFSKRANVPEVPDSAKRSIGAATVKLFIDGSQASGVMVTSPEGIVVLTAGESISNRPLDKIRGTDSENNSLTFVAGCTVFQHGDSLDSKGVRQVNLGILRPEQSSATLPAERSEDPVTRRTKIGISGYENGQRPEDGAPNTLSAIYSGNNLTKGPIAVAFNTGESLVGDSIHGMTGGPLFDTDGKVIGVGAVEPAFGDDLEIDGVFKIANPEDLSSQPASIQFTPATSIDKILDIAAQNGRY